MLFSSCGSYSIRSSYVPDYVFLKPRKSIPKIHLQNAYKLILDCPIRSAMLCSSRIHTTTQTHSIYSGNVLEILKICNFHYFTQNHKKTIDSYLKPLTRPSKHYLHRTSPVLNHPSNTSRSHQRRTRCHGSTFFFKSNPWTILGFQRMMRCMSN